MKKPIVKADDLDAQYQSILGDVSSIIDSARRSAARSVNAVMTAAYWMIGQHIVEFEQSGEERAEYGTALIKRLAADLTQHFGRGFGAVNLSQMKRFYLLWPSERIFQTVSEKLGDTENMPATSAESSLTSIASRFPWYRVDLLFFHRRLRCLVVIDLKLGKFTYADAGQMNLYLNYAREHWTQEDENPPVGLILCSQKDEAVAQYALGGLTNKVLPAEYRTTLPDEELLAAEIDRTRQVINLHATVKSGIPTIRADLTVENPK